MRSKQTQPQPDSTAARLNMLIRRSSFIVILISILTGCSTSSTFVNKTATVTTIQPTVTPVPTSTLFPTPINYIRPCISDPENDMFSFSLPPNTIIYAHNAAHGALDLGLCNFNTSYQTIDQYMQAQMQNDGWHLYNAATDPRGDCMPITLKWTKGNTALHWYKSEVQATSGSSVNWEIEYCVGLNNNG